MKDVRAYVGQSLERIRDGQAANGDPSDEMMEKVEFSGQPGLIFNIQFERQREECDEGIPLCEKRPLDSGH